MEWDGVRDHGKTLEVQWRVHVDVGIICTQSLVTLSKIRFTYNSNSHYLSKIITQISINHFVHGFFIMLFFAKEDILWEMKHD